jgi:tetrahydromethanopterin S-methyltransferase subunit E
VSAQGGKKEMNTDKTYAEKVAAEYAPKETNKVVALKKLDAKAKMGANIFGFTFGIVMTLLFGVGMCFSLKVLGSGELWQDILGYVVGVIGIIGVSINYFIYNKILAKGKQKYGNDIITLANEIIEE